MTHTLRSLTVALVTAAVSACGAVSPAPAQPADEPQWMVRVDTDKGKFWYIAQEPFPGALQCNIWLTSRVGALTAEAEKALGAKVRGIRCELVGADDRSSLTPAPTPVQGAIPNDDPGINPDAWAVTVDARAEGHLSPVWYTAGQFLTKAECEAFKASQQWKEFYLAWAKKEIELHQGKIDFGPAPYCMQVKLIKNYDDPA